MYGNRDMQRDIKWDCDTAGTKLGEGAFTGSNGILTGYYYFDKPSDKGAFLSQGMFAEFWSSIQDNSNVWD